MLLFSPILNLLISLTLIVVPFVISSKKGLTLTSAPGNKVCAPAKFKTKRPKRKLQSEMLYSPRSFNKFISYSTKPGSASDSRIFVILMFLPDIVDKISRCLRKFAPCSFTVFPLILILRKIKLC